MLAQPYRDLLVDTFVKVFPAQLDGQIFFNAMTAGSWNRIVTGGGSYTTAVTQLVPAADEEGWIRPLVQQLIVKFPARPEFKDILKEIDRAAPVKTAADPFDEVLLAGPRPFANRQPLRAALRDLTDPEGPPMLLIDGEQKTGKSFSFYLINHVGPTKNYVVSRFPMAQLPKPNTLAEDILGRIGATRELKPMGDESAERWAEKLADTVKDAIEEKGKARLFVFDDFPDIPLPAGTASFIIRLARYADEELRKYLRVVLMRFRSVLPSELDEVASHEVVQPFTPTDMVAVVMQVAKARQWSVTEDVVKKRVDTYHQTPGRTLNDGFKFLRGLLAELAAAPQ